MEGKWRRLLLHKREIRQHGWKYFRNFCKRNVSLLAIVRRRGFPLPKISFKEILSQRLISQKPSEIFLSKVVENIATSCLKGLQIVGRHSSLIH